MRYRLLGSLEVERADGAVVVITAPMRRALLAFLLLQRGRPASRDSVIDALWGDESPDAATESLFSHVSRLRHELGEHTIRTVPSGYQLVVAVEDFDVLAFERDAALGRQAVRDGDWPRAASALQRGLARWRGPALADVAAQRFAPAEIARLEALRLESVEDLIEAQLELGRHEDVVAELEALVAAHPLRERAWGQLMLALYRGARQADSLARYRQLRRTLRDELGIDPSPSLQELQLRILRQDPSLRARQPGGVLGTVDLPALASSIVGRTREHELAIRLLSEHRILTLTGPGGIGKSRLAVAVAQSMLEQNPDGTRFIDLAVVADPERVAERIGEFVGGGNQPAEVIGRRRMLLVLDNFEQVLDAAPVVSRLVARCPNLRVIVTSRAPLRIGGERQLEVEPLAPDDAVSLFLDRASLDLATAIPTELVATIVDRLDGLPLALELAAARTKALALSTIRDHLTERLGFLTSGSRDAPDRHRTLRETIEWSYRLLAPEAQAAFRNLSVLAAGFGLDAAVAVGQTDLEVIGTLVEQSLLRRVDDRYSMLETIREFARASTTELEASSALGRLLAHYRPLPLAARYAAVGADLENLAIVPTGRDDDDDGALGAGQRQQRWLDLCAADQDNLRVALEWADRSNDREAILDLFLGVGPYWSTVGIPEDGGVWAERAVAAARAIRPEQLTETRLIAIELAKFGGNLERALELLAESVTDATAQGDWRRITDGLDDMAWAHAGLDHDDEAIMLLARSRQVLDAVPGLPAHDQAHLVGTSTEIFLRQERIEEARAAARQFASLVADLPDWAIWNTEALLLSGLVEAADGRTAQARTSLGEVVRRTASRGLMYQLAHALDGLAGLDAAIDPERAARVLGMADNARAMSRLPNFYPRQRARTLAVVRDALGDAQTADLMAEGRDMTPERSLPPGVDLDHPRPG